MSKLDKNTFQNTFTNKKSCHKLHFVEIQLVSYNMILCSHVTLSLATLAAVMTGDQQLHNNH